MKHYLTCLFAFVIPFFAVAHEEDFPANNKFPFIQNLGQWHQNVLFKAEIGGGALFFEKNAFHYQFADFPDHHHNYDTQDEADTLVKFHVVHAAFSNANENPSIEYFHESPNYYNYFLGDDSSKWKGNVHAYKKIKYNELYPGIDLITYPYSNTLKYDYHIAPEANPRQIALDYQGAEDIRIENGRLFISHSLGEFTEAPPYAYQLVNGKPIEVSCEYQINKGKVSFIFPNGYDESKALIIDPTLIFSTYSGSRSGNFGMTATFDTLGAGYMGGTVFTNGYRLTPGAFSTSYNFGSTDIAISKFNSDGSSLIYSTLLGGSGGETVHSMIVDQNLELAVLCVTSSTNYPTTTNAYDRTKETSTTINLATNFSVSFINGTDIAITKFNRQGTALVGSTLFGGNGTDGLNLIPSAIRTYDTLIYSYGDQFRGEIVVDNQNNILIGTCTQSDSLGNTNQVLNGSSDGIVAKFNPDLSNLFWSTYIAGDEMDAVFSLKPLPNGDIAIGGGTASFTNFPTTPNAYASSSFGGVADGFVGILDGTTGSINKMTYVGTSNYDQVFFVESDRFGNVYGFGQSDGGVFPVKNAPIADTGAGQFLIKFDPNLDSLEFSHTFGDGLNSGTINISPTAFLVDKCQNLYISGWGGALGFGEGRRILSANMPITPDALQANKSPNEDFYFYVVNRDLDSLLFGSYFGGNRSDDHVDGGTSRFDKNGIIYQSVCGSCFDANGGGAPSATLSDFPTTPNSAFPIKNVTNTSSGACNNTLFKLDFNILPRAQFSTSADTICLGDSVNIKDLSSGGNVIEYDFYGTAIFTKDLDTTIVFTAPGLYNISQVVEDTVCQTDDAFSTRILVRPNNLQLTTIPDTNICYGDSVDLIAFSQGTSNQFRWDQGLGFSNPFITSDSIYKVPLSVGSNIFYVMAENVNTFACEVIDSVEVKYFPTFADATISEDSLCEGSPIDLTATFVNLDTFRWILGDSTFNSIDSAFQYQYASPGDYRIEFQYRNDSCTVSDTLIKNLHIQANNLRFDTLPDSLYCNSNGALVSQNAFGTAKQFLWSSSSNFSDTLNNFPNDSSLNLNTNGRNDFYIKMIDKLCEVTDTVNLEFIRYDVSWSNLVDSVCTNDAQVLNTTLIGVDSFLIRFGNGDSTFTNGNPTLSYNQAGIYQVNLIASNNRCNLNTNLVQSVQVFQDVSLLALPDSIICFGDTIDLIGNSQGSAAQFLWDTLPSFVNPININNDSVLRFAPQKDLTFYLRGINGICDADESVNIRVEELEVDLNDLESICIDDTISLQAFPVRFINPLSYSWQPFDSIISGANTTTISIAPKQDLDFILTSTSSIGCETMDTVTVEVQIPAFDDALVFATDDSIYGGQNIQLSTNRNGSNLVYQWEPAAGLDNPNSPNPNANPTQTTLYKVTITDLNTGCDVIAFKRVKVFEIVCAEPDIFIPTAFTPNGDGDNDVLYVRGNNLFEIRLEIYNRWGELVFETTDINTGWNGTYKGSPVDPNVFAYHLTAICFDGQEYYSQGNITVIR